MQICDAASAVAN